MQINNFYPSVTFTTAQDAINPGEDLRAAKKILDSLDLNWYLAFGTALGFYRDKDFIKGDTDIDVAVLVDSKTDIDKMIDKFIEKYELIRLVSDDGKVMQVCFQGLDYFIIDICFFYRNGEIYESLCEGGRWEDKVANVGYQTELKTKYGIFPIPFNIESYLTDRYGDWQTPRYGKITSSIKA